MKKEYDLPAIKSSAALHYAARGWPVLPVQPTSKAPIGRLAPNGCKDATTDEQEIHDWWNVVPSANIGVATGDVFVVDLDVKNGTDGVAAWEALVEDRRVPETLTVRTPSGGRHLYFRAPEGVTVSNSTGKIAPGIDVRGRGGYVVVPPSSTDAGRYEFVKEESVADAPSWLLEKLTAASSNGHRPAPPVEGDIPKGERNSRLTSLAGSMRRRGMTEAAMRAALLEENLERCEPPLPEKEVRQIAASVSRYPPSQRPPDAELSPEIGLRMADVEIEPVRWLWEGRIPIGELTIFDGDPGEGKSTVLCDVAARLSKGRPMPTARPAVEAVEGGAVLVTAEDSPAHTIRPRLEAAGADLERVILVPTVPDGSMESGCPSSRKTSTSSNRRASV